MEKEENKEEYNYIREREQEGCEHIWEYGMVVLGQAVTPRECRNCGKREF